VLPPIFTNSSHYLPLSVRLSMRDTVAVVTSAYLVVIYLHNAFGTRLKGHFQKGSFTSFPPTEALYKMVIQFTFPSQRFFY